MKTLILFALFILSLGACTKSENLVLPSLNQSWQEIEPKDIYQLEGSTFTQFQLNRDNTFILINHTWTDALPFDDPCRGIDTYFAFGTYSYSSDSLYLDGCYSDDLFKTCTATCTGETSFMEAYHYILTGRTLTLNPEEHPMVRRVLEERVE